MPRKSNSNNGKPLFDLNNLEQAEKLLERISTIFNNHTSSAEQYMKDTDKLTKLYEKLNKLAAGSLKELDFSTRGNKNKSTKQIESEIQNLRELVNVQAKVLEQQKQITEEKEKEQNIDKQQLVYNKTLDSELEKQWNKRKKQISDEYDKMSLLMKSVTNKDNYIADRMGDKQTYINSVSRVADAENEFSIKTTGSSLSKSDILGHIDEYFGEDSNFNVGSKKFKVGSELLQVGSDTLKVAANTLKSLATKGLNNQTSVFENTFTDISVRNGTTRGDYYSAQSSLNGILSDMDLNNNIASSEVQQMWSTLAKQGIEVDLKNQDTIRNSIETALTNQVVPYLDMSSAYMQQLSISNPTLMKQVRGIGASIQSVEGSNATANKYLQDMLDNLSPMAELANQEIGLQYADTLGQLEDLRKQGLSDSQIGQIYSKIKTMGEDQYAAISSGDTITRLTVTDMMDNNEDFHDNSKILNYYLRSMGMFTGDLPTGNNSQLYAGIFSKSLGGGDAALWDTLRTKGVNVEQAIRAGDLAASRTNGMANQVTENFKNDINQTNTKLQDTTLENFMNELAVVDEYLGNWTDVVVTAIKGLGTLLVTWLGTNLIGGIVGKGVGALAGSAAGGIGSGLFGALGAAGPIALGIGAIAGTVALINSKVSNQHEEERQNNMNSRQGTYQASIDAGLSESEAISNAWNDDFGIKGNGVFENGGETNLSFYKNTKGVTGQWYQEAQSFEDFVNDDNVQMNMKSGAGGSMLEAYSWLDKDTRQALGLTPKAMQSGYDEAKTALDKARASYDRNTYNKIKTYALGKMLATNTSIPFNYTMAALSAAVILGGYSNDNDIVGPLNDDKYGFKGNVITDKNKLQSVLDANGITEAKYLTAIYKILGDKNTDFYLMAKGKDNWMTFPSAEDLKSNFNLHRYGLNEVPYDNYPALLHEGEAVLTASTANEMRNLVDEYRATNEQSANFEAVIQNQTTELITKMDQIINVISNNDMLNNTNIDTNESSRKLRNSMLKVSSTKGF